MTPFRRDFAKVKKRRNERRPDDRLVAHYELETELANRLRNCKFEDRATVYGDVYSRLFESLPDHPQRTANRRSEPQKLKPEINYLMPHLTPETTFLEIGCGDAALAIRMANHVLASYGIDVTAALLPGDQPENFHFLKTDGVHIPLPDASVDIAYSNQLMEHLHPDDAKAQLREIRRVLKPGGRYLCSTPSRVTGPHDISCFFAYEARGFHLREYDYGSLRQLLNKAGFGRIQPVLFAKGRRINVPYSLIRTAEVALLAAPPRLRASLTGNPIVHALMGINLIATR